MRTTAQRVTKEVYMVTTGITCNFCGVTYSGPEIDMEPITEFYISSGYGSRFDDTIHHLDICDDCLESLLNKLKVKA